MKMLMFCGMLSLSGLFACVESQQGNQNPVSESTIENDLHSDELTSQPPVTESLCCIDFDCPSNGYSTTGCKIGAISIAKASADCIANCDVSCDRSGFYCM